MTPEDFRRLALNLPKAEEHAHHGIPDFRVRGKIFATLGWPDLAWAMVKLTPEEQEILGSRTASPPTTTCKAT
jgi:YjbR